MPDGVDHLGGAERTPIQPSNSHSPATEPSPAPTRPTADVTVDLRSLPSGASPRVPWYADGVIHDGDRTVGIGNVAKSAPVSFVSVAGGYLVQVGGTTDSPATSTRLVRADGTVVRTLPGDIELPLDSADGRTMTWAGATGPRDDSAALVLTDAVTGADLARKKVDLMGPRPVGFLRGRVAFTDDAADGGTTGIWEPGTGRISWLGRAAQRGLGTDGNDRLLVVTRTDPSTGVARCSAVRDLAAGGQRWETCGLHAWGFLGSGRYVVGDTGRDGGPMVVADAGTGRTLLWVDVTSQGNPATATRNPVMEPAGPDAADGAVLVQVVQGSRAALVRCTLSGRCELATPVRRIAHEGEEPALPATFGAEFATAAELGGDAGAGAAGN